jgi:hypothetical protein
MMRGSPKPAPSGPPRLWSVITTIIIIAASRFEWDRDTTGITTITTIIITIAGIEEAWGILDPDALFILRPHRGFDCFSPAARPAAAAALIDDGAFEIELTKAEPSLGLRQVLG